MGALYQLISPSGKSYIGISSKSTESRWAKHVEHALGKRDSGALYSALRKYGSEAFTVKTLLIASDWEYLCEMERRAIVAFNSKAPHGYNITDGGEGVIGRIATDEQRKAISRSQKIRFQRPEEQERLRLQGVLGGSIRAVLRGEEGVWRKAKKVSTFTSKLNHSLATRAGMSDPEVKQRLSESAKRRLERPEELARLKNLNVGRKQDRSQQWNANLKTGIAAAWADPVKKAQRIEKNRLAKQRRLAEKESASGN